MEITMNKTFDVSKFRKNLTKSVPGLSTGFRDPDTWISTGNYTLNKLISGDFHKGIPLGKVTVLAGASGAGKSYIASGNIVRNAQEQGIFVVLIDSENALDEAWLKALNVDTSEDKLLKLNMAMIDDVAKTINDFIKQYKEEYQRTDENKKIVYDGPKVLFVIDSLGMLLTPTDVDQFSKGDLKGDMGRKPKALTALVRNTVNQIADLNMGLIATNHTYSSQDMFDPDDKISGGQGFIYASSIVVAMDKLKLKVDENGIKTSQVHGIRAKCKIMKTRYSKPFETVELEIPYSTGLNPYSGLFEYLVSKEILVRTGNKYVYVDSNGTEHKYFEKEFKQNPGNIFDIIMSEWNRDRDKKNQNESLTDDDNESSTSTNIT
jgi:RecA/RadA recombinase